MDIKQRINELERNVDHAIDSLSLEDKESELEELREIVNKPEFWDDSKTAAKKSKRVSVLENQVNFWRSLEGDVKALSELLQAGETEGVEKEVQDLERRYKERERDLIFSGEYDERDAILSIHAGTGGTDAQDFAEMIERMYLRYCSNNELTAKVIDESKGEEAGIKSATIEVSGEYAYGLLKSEHGVHRLVRQSPFNADNLRQTSFVKVEVVPSIDEPSEVDLEESDIKVDTFRASGHGGQSVNTTDSAVRVTHIPTGTVVSIQNERSQTQNRETALKVLRSKLKQLAIEQHEEKISELKGVSATEQWGQQIRNYVLHPYTLVKDTRTNHETSNVQKVLDGEIQEFIDAYLKETIGEES